MNLKPFLIGLLVTVGLTAGPSIAQTSPPLDTDEFRVTLLGTGSPAPLMRRFGPGVLVQAGGKTLLIDCGRGTTQRLMQSGLKLGQVDALFLTHLHSNHKRALALRVTGLQPTGQPQVRDTHNVV